MIQKGVNLNKFDIYGKSLLTYAIDNKDKEVFNFLLNSENLDINAQNNQGQTYLMYLFEKISGNSSSSSSSQTSISKVSDGDWFTSSIVQERNMYSSRPKMNSMQYTPISSLSTNSTNENIHLTFFMQILNHPKLNINTTDYLDNTLLSLIISTSNMNLLTRVIKHKDINVNTQNYQGVTPFMIAVVDNLWNNAKLLLENGANPEIKDGNGRTARCCLDHKNRFIYDKLFKVNTVKNMAVGYTMEIPDVIKTVEQTIDQTIEQTAEQIATSKRWFF